MRPWGVPFKFNFQGNSGEIRATTWNIQIEYLYTHTHTEQKRDPLSFHSSEKVIKMPILENMVIACVGKWSQNMCRRIYVMWNFIWMELIILYDENITKLKISFLSLNTPKRLGHWSHGGARDEADDDYLSLAIHPKTAYSTYHSAINITNSISFAGYYPV